MYTIKYMHRLENVCTSFGWLNKIANILYKVNYWVILKISFWEIFKERLAIWLRGCNISSIFSILKALNQINSSNVGERLPTLSAISFGLVVTWHFPTSTMYIHMFSYFKETRYAP